MSASDEIEAIHIVALAIDEVQKRGTTEHSAALEMLNDGRTLWREQHQRRMNPTCQHCGKALRPLP